MKLLLAASALGATGLLSLAAVPAQAAAPAGAQVCGVRAVTVEARDLQQDVLGTDQIFLRMGAVSTTIQDYDLGQLRNTLSTGEGVFTGQTTVRLFENDGPGISQLIDTVTVPCQPAGRIKVVLTDGDARYRVALTVRVLP